MKNIAAGASAIDLKRGLDRGLRAVVARLKELSRPVADHKQRVQVATISAHNDSTIGEMVADALEKVGAEGTTSVEEAKGTETTVEVVEGMRLDRGYLSPYFITDPEKMKAMLDEPLILLYEKKISTMTGSAAAPRADRQERQGAARRRRRRRRRRAGDAGRQPGPRGILPCVAVKAPGYGDRRRAMLEDLAILTGGRLIAEELGIKLANVTLDDLGRAKRIIADKDSTTIVGGAGAKEAIEGRANEIRAQIKTTTSDYDREKLEERLAKLTGGVAVIRVGAPSEAELKNRREAFDDAISATKAAMAEGIVPVADSRCCGRSTASTTRPKPARGDERTGVLILKRALETPTRQIAENSGVDGGVVVDRMRSGSGAFGFDAGRGTYVDLVDAGIIDPTKVVRVALENAVSVAGIAAADRSDADGSAGAQARNAGISRSRSIRVV